MKILKGNQNKNFRTKSKILEGKQKCLKRKPKISEGNQTFWEQNKTKFLEETKMNILEEIQKIREENNNSRQKSQFLERSIFGGKQKKIERKFHTSGLLQIH